MKIKYFVVLIRVDRKIVNTKFHYIILNVFT